MKIAQKHQQHDTHNEEYLSAKAALFAKSPKAGASQCQPIATARLDKLCEEMDAIARITGPYVESIDLFVSYFDDIILECAVYTNRRAEIETKIIELCKRALKKPTKVGTRNPQEEHTTASLIDALSQNPSQESATKITDAILDDTNPLRLGLTLYEAFCEENPALVNPPIIHYLQTEAAVRTGLILGNDTDVVAHLEQLLKSKIDVPEKYLLASLNSFYHGFDKDAQRALDIGLKKFPENKRLISSRNALRG